MVQKDKAGQMFKCALKSMVVSKDGVKLILVEAPKGILETMAEFVGNEIMVIFESPQGSLFLEDKTSKP